jgi:hypothetical protein
VVEIAGGSAAEESKPWLNGTNTIGSRHGGRGGLENFLFFVSRPTRCMVWHITRFVTSPCFRRSRIPTIISDRNAPFCAEVDDRGQIFGPSYLFNLVIGHGLM